MRSEAGFLGATPSAAPLLLTALCVAVPAQLGLVVIGGEGALVLGGLSATWAGLMLDGVPGPVVQFAMAAAGAGAGAVWLGLVGLLRARRGINETVTSLVMAYIAIALFNQLVEGPLRDPASLNKPSTYAIPKATTLPTLPGLDVHPGILIGGVACVLCWLLIARTTTGFAARVTGSNVRAAQLQGLPGVPFGGWSSVPQVQSALTINPLFLVGVAIAFGMAWMFRATRLGLRLRIVGDGADAARALGLDINRTRLLATMAGSALTGVGGALGPSLQAVGVTSYYYLFYAALFVLTLAVLVATVRPGRAAQGMPGELSIAR